jgi:histidine kinase/DNA gyrase B/HSP90-like ATPase
LKGIKLRVVPAGIAVFSHPVLLSGILGNLIRNAIDYTPHGGRVCVACRRRGSQVHLQIRDSGVGIPADELAEVLRAFHRTDATCSEGLGLGLFIVKRAANLLGHRVQVASAAGRGSCFAVVANAAPTNGGATWCRGTTMTDPERPIDDSNFIRRLLVAWVVAVWAIAIGAFLLVFHQPGGDDRMVSRRYESPVAGGVEWGSDPLVRRGTEEALPQSGSSTVAETPPNQR